VINLDEFNQQAKETKAENKKFYKKLKSINPKKLDQAFHNAHEEAFSCINCLECANCCKTTGPLFTNTDIDKLARHFKMKAGDFMDQYLRKDEDGDFVLQSTPCPFLGDDNYCSVYENRPKACREYPHTDRNKMHQILELTRKNAEMCPAVHHVTEALKRQFK
tara:strand:+ start:105 stop:593 length:489 start_codon:yes stop_codon:yes gene_type:complete